MHADCANDQRAMSKPRNLKWRELGGGATPVVGARCRDGQPLLRRCHGGSIACFCLLACMLGAAQHRAPDSNVVGIKNQADGN